MTEYPSLSKLPKDQAYWDELETRLMADLRPRVRDAALPRPGGWNALAARASGLTALAAAAGFAALVLVPSRAPAPEKSITGILRAPDDDPITAAFLSAPAPPALASLMLPLDSPGEQQ